MSADEGKGVKPPRTLFSLGRPGAKKDRGGTAVADEPVVEDVAVDEPVAETEEIQYACGACGALLPTGAAFCGECGTPVATDGFDEEDLLADEGIAPGGLLDEAFVADEEEPLVEEDPLVEEEAVEPAAEEEAVEPAAEAEPIEPDATDDDTATTVSPLVAGAAAAGVVGAAGMAAAGADELIEGPDELLEESAIGEAPVEEVPPAAAEAAEAPAAVLYADPSVVEPLPDAPGGSFSVSEPTVGSVDDTLPGSPDDTVLSPAASAAGVDTGAEAPADEGHGVGAPLVAGAVAGGVAGAAMAGEAALAEPAVDATSPLSELVAPPAPEVAQAGAGAPPPAGAPATFGTSAQDMPYGHGPLETSPKSKTPLILAGVGGLIVLAIIVGVILAAGGSKNEDVATSPSSAVASSTTAKATSTTEAPSSTSSSTSTTAAPETTTTTAAPETTTTTAAVAPMTTAAPSGGGGGGGTPGLPSSVITSPPPTVAPGRINVASSPANIPKGGEVVLTLTNVGGSAAAYGPMSGLSNNYPPGQLGPGQSATLRFRASPSFEGQTQITGPVDGVGIYRLTVTVRNG